MHVCGLLRLVGTLEGMGLGWNGGLGQDGGRLRAVAGLIRWVSRIATADRDIRLSTVVARSSNRLSLLFIPLVTIRATGVALLRSWE